MDITVTIVLIVSVIIFFYVYACAISISRQLKAFELQAPDFRFGGSFIRYFLKGHFAGLSFSISVIPGGHRSGPVITVFCSKDTPFNIRIVKDESRSNLFTCFFCKPVLSSIAKTGDPHFDSSFSIYTRNNADVSGFFYNTDRKEAVINIFEYGYTHLELTGRGIACYKYYYNSKTDLRTETLWAIIDSLIVLSKGF